MSSVIQRALISVSDKTNLIPFAQALLDKGVQIISTGGTLNALLAEGLEATDIEAFTGFPQILNGRVKTLHPRVHAGILARRDVDHDTMVKHDLKDIDLVVVNLYPFEQVAKRGGTMPQLIEHIDIGGPTMIRAAAKNHAWVSVVVDPNDYDYLLNQMGDGLEVPEDVRFRFAKKAFAHTAKYDSFIASTLGKYDDHGEEKPFSDIYHPQYHLAKTLRYGENPQQQAALYQDKHTHASVLGQSVTHQGKPLSFNNLVDAETALTCCYALEHPACVIVKHANPCGAAKADSLMQAYQKAFECDKTSAFGGIIAFNQTVDEHLIHAIYDNQFVEVIVAPAYTQKALEACARKENVRVIATGSNAIDHQDFDVKRIRGGLLVQSWDDGMVTPDQCTVPTRLAPSMGDWDDLLFAWTVAKYVKSNAIVLAKNQSCLGVGAGQMSRVYSVNIAKDKACEAGFDLQGCVLASDAFFPFKDSIEHAASIGVKAIIQPGGSIRDNEVIQACDEAGIAMVFTHMRHFRH